MNRRDEEHNSFGSLLARKRRKRDITLRKLGELVGLSPSFLSEIETGRRLPPKEEEKIRDLALVLGEDEQDFLEAAKKERAKNDPKVFEKLLSFDPDLAWGLYRAETRDEVEKALEEALETLKERGREVGESACCSTAKSKRH